MMNKNTLKYVLILLIISFGFGILTYYTFTYIYQKIHSNNSTQTTKQSLQILSDSHSKASLLLELDVSKIYTQEQLDNLMQNTIDIIKRRIEQYGVTNAEIKKEGNKFILVNLPSVLDIEEIGTLITNNEKLEFRLVQHDAASNDALNKIYAIDNPLNEDGTLKAELQKLLPSGVTVMEQKEGGYLAVANEVALSGKDLESVYVVDTEYGYPAISLNISHDSAKKFGNFTGANIGRQLAIIVGNKILSAPVINARISARAQITGQFTKDEARQLAIVLDTGTLPTQVKIVKRQVAFS